MKMDTIIRCITDKVLKGRLTPVLLLFIFGLLSAEAQSNGDYRSQASGSWNWSASWEQFNGTNWLAASTAPSAAATVTIQTNHSIGVNFQALSISGNLVIENGGTLYSGFLGSFSIGPGGLVVVETGGFLVLTSGFLSSPDISVEGTLSINGGTVISEDFTGAGTTIMTDGELEIQGRFNPDPVATFDLSGGTVVRDNITTNQNADLNLQAYQIGDEVYVEFMDYDAKKAGFVDLKRQDKKGKTIWSETKYVSKGSKVISRFKVPGLKAGDRYDFQLIDQDGKLNEVSGVPVQNINSSMSLSPHSGVAFDFNSLPDRDYEIQWAANLGADWQTITNLTTSGEQVSIQMEYPDSVNASGFFRLVLK